MKKLFYIFVIFYSYVCLALNFQMVDNQEELQNFLIKVMHAKTLAIDTEFYGQPATIRLIQVGIIKNDVLTPDIYLVDIQKINAQHIELSDFFKIFSDETVVKIFHAAKIDIQLINALLPQGSVENIWDTQIAESFLGMNNAISYKDIVQKYFAVGLSKEQQTSDWEKAQLTPAQQEYAAYDVHYLPEIYNRQVFTLANRPSLTDVKVEMRNQLVASAADVKSLKKTTEKFRLRSNKNAELKTQFDKAKSFLEWTSQTLGIAKEALAKDSEIKAVILGQKTPARFCTAWRYTIIRKYFLSLQCPSE
ncbi:MAG: ribonuclease D [Myxococcales bacterium]|nr:ribonuclease D [Myxococcales bacterium]USN50989.1 MAG: ribonuclease D [Myxococcales bacterium]